MTESPVNKAPGEGPDGLSNPVPTWSLVPFQALPGTITLPLPTCGQPVTKGQNSDTEGHKFGFFRAVGFIGTDYITTPIRKPECRELLQWEHEWNNQVSSYRAPVERAVATLKTWRILFTDYRRPLKTFRSSFRAATGLYFFKESFA
jgi:hypothetical protein